MYLKKALAATALGLGIVLLPSAALAAPSVSNIRVSGSTVTANFSGCPTGTSKDRASLNQGQAVSIHASSVSGNTVTWTGIKPGTYTLALYCNGDNENVATARVVVGPGGGPMGGDGGRVDNGLGLATGVAMVGIAGAGYVLMRRRATANR